MRMNHKPGGVLRWSWLSLALVSALALAQGPDGKKPPRPPKEAFDACAGMAVNDPCAMTMPDGNTLDGTCQAAPAAKKAATSAAVATTDLVLACRPEHMPPPPEGQDQDPASEEE